MNPQATKINMLKSVLLPSGFSVVLTIFLMGLVVFLHQIPAIEQYLELPKNFSFAHIFSSWADKMLTTYIGESRTETLVVGLFWAGVGLCVYIFLRGISHFATDVSQGFDERQYLWPKGADRNAGVSEATRRVGFQILAFIGLLVVTFGPLQRILGGPIWQGFIGPDNILQMTVWFVVGCFVMYLWIVLLRLALLRARVFS
jgi:hypothetical protein